MNREEWATAITRLLLVLFVLATAQSIWHPVRVTWLPAPFGLPPAATGETVLDRVRVTVHGPDGASPTATVYVYRDRDPAQRESFRADSGYYLTLPLTPNHRYTFVAESDNRDLSAGVERDLTRREDDWGKPIPDVDLYLPR